jgi:Tol biopolymer transport system component
LEPSADQITFHNGSAKGPKNGIAFASDRVAPNDRTNIYVTSPNGRRTIQLTTEGTDIGHPDWSPDHSKIAFSWRADIYVMNADGSALVNLTNDAQSDVTPTWSPDGSRIAFVRYRTGRSDLFVMNAAGSRITQLTH